MRGMRLSNVENVLVLEFKNFEHFVHFKKLFLSSDERHLKNRKVSMITSSFRNDGVQNHMVFIAKTETLVLHCALQRTKRLSVVNSESVHYASLLRLLYFYFIYLFIFLKYF